MNDESAERPGSSGEPTDENSSTIEFNPSEHPLVGRGKQGAGSGDQPTEASHQESVLREAYGAGDVIEGRYEIRERLGRGGFGAVYSAFDRSLNRVVAIKQSTGLRSFVAGQVRNEARAVASLNHPNIVHIHDLIQVGPHEMVIVMECLDGIPLSKRLSQSRMSVVEGVKIGVEVVSALMHAHEKQLVHSDLKPANLFLCRNGLVKLLDFGLAVAYFPNQGAGYIGGTPGYMSPEQVRGESHLIDGRTDIWAFGVVMYEMLTGTRPFSGADARMTNERTLIKSVPPPRQLNPDIDGELQRVILKCLQPLIKSRYPSAVELREDLVHWLQSQGEAGNAGLSDASHHLSPELGSHKSSDSSLRIGMRGLQPFTEMDASTYLSLIPGPRDRNGIPDSIRFWKRWVESDDPNTEYPVGVLYGPSGAGKTSYVRAGLFKHLGSEICRVYVECRPGDLGGRLTRVIESRLHSDAGKSSLRDLLHRLRSGDSKSHGFQKLLIVLDQFESWAHTASLDERLDFAESLRQCDGVQIRALVVTRDDYWSGAKELLRWLEIPMQEGRNVASVDLLDRPHAERILEAMGRESEILPPEGQSLTSQQSQFITQAVNELTIDGSVICVHLVMFAQMVKLQSWTPHALHSSGGVAGACSLFFQELFQHSSRHSPEYHRVAPAVPGILAKLLPRENSTVSEVSASEEELVEAASEAGQTHLFNDCMRILCEDLRIVSVIGTDVPMIDGEPRREAISGAADRYRLAHDFLVEPINVFLTRAESRSWRGRTRSRLTELSETWSRRQLNAYLPGFTEYLSLIVGSCFQRRGEKESRFLRAATKLHAGRISVAVISLIAFMMMTFLAWHQWTVAGEARRLELTTRVDALFNNADPDEFEQGIRALRAYGDDATTLVSTWQDSMNEQVQLRSRIYMQTVRPESLQGIVPLLQLAPTPFFNPILAIARQAPDANTLLRDAAEDASATTNADRAAILLAYLGDDSALRPRMLGSNDAEADHAFLIETTTWRGDPNLWAVMVGDASNDSAIRYSAAVVLGGYSNSQLQQAGVVCDYAALINAPDATVHSIGRFLARHMGEDVFDFAAEPPAQADWRIGPDETPMVRIGPASFEYEPSQRADIAPVEQPNVGVQVERPFWMSTIPVSRRLYAEFVSSDATLPDGSEKAISLERFNMPDYLIDDERQPMLGASLAQAYAFCNWLSLRDGLTECYQFRGEEPAERTRELGSFRPVPWDFDPAASGYRVPTLPEYELALRCGYQRGPVSIHSIELAKAGGDYRPDESFAHPLFTFIPNRFGLFLYDHKAGTRLSGHPRYVSVYPTVLSVRKSFMSVGRFPPPLSFLHKTISRSDRSKTD